MTARERYHVIMAELLGRLAGRLLLSVARHAYAINDQVTLYRATEVVQRGVEIGWDETPEARVVPNRRLTEQEEVGISSP